MGVLGSSVWLRAAPAAPTGAVLSDVTFWISVISYQRATGILACSESAAVAGSCSCEWKKKYKYSLFACRKRSYILKAPTSCEDKSQGRVFALLLSSWWIYRRWKEVPLKPLSSVWEQRRHSDAIQTPFRGRPGAVQGPVWGHSGGIQERTFLSC